jgi:hypothetical protein
MADDDLNERLAQLSSGTKRLLDYVAVLPGGARYAVLRHIARISEEDMVVDLREAVDAGLLSVLSDRPNAYDLTSDALRSLILDQIGPERLPKLRARAEAARRRVEDAGS